MSFEIHVYLHILTPNVVALQAEVDRLKAEIPTADDQALLDSMMASANGLAAAVAADGSEPLAPTPA